MTPYAHMHLHIRTQKICTSLNHLGPTENGLDSVYQEPDLVTVKTIVVSGLTVVKGQVFNSTCYGRSCELKTSAILKQQLEDMFADIKNRLVARHESWKFVLSNTSSFKKTTWSLVRESRSVICRWNRNGCYDVARTSPSSENFRSKDFLEARLLNCQFGIF